jgi:ribosome maturation protein Sdo1
MLKDILKAINRDGYISKSMLSAELKTSEGMIEEGINQLMRMGYLIKEETGEDCSTFCVSCPFAKTCNKEVIRTYKISDKGLKIIS